jgi:hypothetical protein
MPRGHVCRTASAASPGNSDLPSHSIGFALCTLLGSGCCHSPSSSLSANMLYAGIRQMDAEES